MRFFYDIITPREMRKYFAFFIAAIVCVAGFGAMAAEFQVKKSSSVKKQEQSGLESVTSNSLLPGVVNLVANVAALNKQQKELNAECAPTQSELNWVNNMVKEYAKIGEVSAEEMLKTVGDEKCDPGDSFEYSVQNSLRSNFAPCVDVFDSDAETSMIWYEYPKASKAEYCADGMAVCNASKKKTYSNIYKIFGAIDFTDVDYTADEANMYVKFMEKTEKCAPEKISARNREAYKNFLTSTISNAGQSTNTGVVLDAIGGMVGNSGLGGVSNLAPTVIQFLDK